MIQFKFYSLGRIKLILSRLLKIHDYANCILTNEYIYFVVLNKNIIKLEITLIDGIVNENGIVGTINIMQMYTAIKCIPAMLECLVEWNKNDYLYVKAMNSKNQLSYESKIKILQSSISLKSLYFSEIIETNIYADTHLKVCLKSILWILEKFVVVNDTIKLTFLYNKLLITTELDGISGFSEIPLNNNSVGDYIINIDTNKLINILTNLEIFSNHAFLFVDEHTLELCILSHLDSNRMIVTLN